jgi:C1A family cysteine protease
MISISAQNWENYGGGVFRCSSNAKVDHAVLLVGYDSTKWIVKNQWGSDWGEDGYIWVTRNRTNNCKIGSSVHQLSDFKLTFNNVMLLILIAISLNLLI